MTSLSKTWLGKFWASLFSKRKRRQQSARPRTITDLCARYLAGEQTYESFTRLWGEWLSEFHHSPSMAAVFNPPPVGFPKNYSALLAGTVEYLAYKHNLPMPYWVHDARFYLKLGSEFIPVFEECPNLSPSERQVMLEVIKSSTPTQIARHGVLIRAKALKWKGSRD